MSRRRDWAIAAGVLLVAWAEQLIGGRHLLGLHLALAAVMALPLGFAQRRPWLPAVACGAALIAYGAVGEEPDATGEIFALAGSCFLLGSRMSLRHGLAALLALTLASGMHLALLGALADIAFVAGIFLFPPFALGRGVRGRRRRIEELSELNRRLAEERERTSQLAAAAERARITHDIEQVVAAGLDLMIAAAARGEQLAEVDPVAATDSFEAIRATGAEATGELRRLLRMLQA
jgi:signal transduction histidine kinase